MAQLLTHPDVKEGLAAAQKAAPEKEEKKAQQPWTLAGMPCRDWLKQQAHVKAQRKEEEKKAKAQAAEVKKGRRCCCQGRCRCPPAPPTPIAPSASRNGVGAASRSRCASSSCCGSRREEARCEAPARV
jgi:hypothetical protein